MVVFGRARVNWLAYFTDADCFCVVLVVYFSDAGFEDPAGAFAPRLFHKNATEQRIASSKSTCGIQLDCVESVTENENLGPP